ncbi:hypothetical protein, conserved [Babesia ovata]|uniref:C3H1-type domain-containing protein n=1 Tax=Babesia ovata TaxID=189622 RepID=A0A2H6KJE5_9APIC|nr:uncharacterized protein BOVATA_045930 [Babesia ovata]GBE63100.1 hypothetical protein, conserved [Babesia ovata]
MAFLHGVLRDVRDNNYLSPYKEKLTEAVPLLETHRNNGKTGLRDVIDDVKRGIEQWLEMVKGKSGGVKGPLGDLEDNIIKDEKLRLEDEKEKTLQDQFREWSTRAGGYVSKVVQAEEAREKLDPELKKKLETPMKLIKQPVEGFQKSCENNDLESMLKSVEEEHRKVKEYVEEVKRTADEAVITAFDPVEENIGMLRFLIGKVEKAIKGAEEKSTQLIGVAKNALQTAQENNRKMGALDNLVKDELTKRVNDIKAKTEELEALLISQIQTPLDNSVSQILTTVGNLSEAVGENSKKTIEGLLDKLYRTEFRNLKNLVDMTKLDYEEALKKLPPARIAAPVPPPNLPKSSAEQAADAAAALEATIEKALGINLVRDKKVCVKSKNFANHVDAAVQDAQEYVANLVNTFSSEVKHHLEASVEEIGPILYEVKKRSAALNSVTNAVQKTVTDLGAIIAGLETNSDSLTNKIKTCKEANEAAKKYVNERLTGAVKESKRRVQAYIDDISYAIMNMLDKATGRIKSDAQRSYAGRMRTELEGLKGVITHLKTQIESVIYVDSGTGIKGLMSKLQGTPEASAHQGTNLLEALKDRQNSDPKKEFNTLSATWKDYLKHTLDYITKDTEKIFPAVRLGPGQPMTPHKYRSDVTKVEEAVDDLLYHCENNKNIYHFDHEFQKLLATLTDAVNGLSPDKFGATSCNVLDVLKIGMSQFCAELQTAYVNRYCDREYDTSDDTKYAKVFMTILRTLIVSLEKVNEKCNTNGDWKDKKVCEMETDRKNPLGVFFENSGFKVPPGEGSKQGGELKYKDNWKGENVFGLLKDSKTGLFKEVKNAFESDVLDILHALLHNYYSTCHLNHIPTPATPTSVYKMLVWLSGFWYNPMYDKVCVYVRDLFDKPKEESKLQDASSYVLEATTLLSATTITDTLSDVCDHAEKTLVAILGFGHADGEYAVEFTDNSHKLLYPSSPSHCLDLLFEILCRVYHQLNFVYEQCRHGQVYGGWNSCWYGKGVAGSAWDCNSMQCPNQPANQNADQKGNQMCTLKHDQNCDQNVSCGLKSPLQSFLEDGLPGFLPHSFTTPNCKITCQMSKHFGLPCKTPMGFADISIAASHCKTGDHIMSVLSRFCGKEHSVLGQLCSFLQCLLQRTPQTLDEMFAFYYGLLNGWNDKDKQRMKHKRHAFNDAVNKAYFNERYDGLDITPMFKSSEQPTSVHGSGNLLCLTSCRNTATTLTCGPYLQPLCQNTWTVFSNKRADKYLSWIVYLTETFYEILKMLYDDCCATCDKRGTKCYEKCSVNGCPVIYPDASKRDTAEYKTEFERYQTSNHTKECSSIVKCKNTRPTLYKYGFNFGSAVDINNRFDANKKRTCRDLCNALDRVLSKNKSDAAPLAKLIYETIPNFLWTIRTPFSYLLLALWSLSLLYLLHIAVVRLDVLRIRSHLRSPSSHRIAAQSLLAAARVKALANVKYFSP